MNRNKFGYLLDLIPMAEKIPKMKAICVKCGIDASFTYRRATKKDKIVKVGGIEMYKPVCRSCYHESVTKKEEP